MIAKDPKHHFVQVILENHMFGFLVNKVQDVIYTPQITSVPLSDRKIAGLLNLRGRIVTALDLGIILGLRPAMLFSKNMCVVFDVQGELYSFIVESIGDVVQLSEEEFDNNPATLESRWREISSGIYRLKKQLLVALDDKQIFHNLSAQLS